MKKSYFLLSIPLISLAILLMAPSTGSPGSYSGSPGDENRTCTYCHTGTINLVNNWITSNVPLTGYVPGNTYTITASGTHAGVVRFGFELTSENSDGGKVGTFIITDPDQTKLVNNNRSVTHTIDGITPFEDSKTWSFDWTAPAEGTGEVRLNAAFNAANGNGGTLGDVIYESYTFISEGTIPAEITGIIPDEADQGASIATTISGSGTSWTGTPSVTLTFGFPAEVITATNVIVTNETTIQAEFNIPSDASAGLWDVNVDGLILEEGFEVHLFIGLNEYSFTTLDVYPNPTNGILNLKISEAAQVSLWDVSGNQLRTYRAESGGNTIDLTGIPAGIYFLNIIGNRKVERRKIIVN